MFKSSGVRKSVFGFFIVFIIAFILLIVDGILLLPQMIMFAISSSSYYEALIGEIAIYTCSMLICGLIGIVISSFIFRRINKKDITSSFIYKSMQAVLLNIACCSLAVLVSSFNSMGLNIRFNFELYITSATFSSLAVLLVGLTILLPTAQFKGTIKTCGILACISLLLSSCCLIASNLYDLCTIFVFVFAMLISLLMIVLLGVVTYDCIEPNSELNADAIVKSKKEKNKEINDNTINSTNNSSIRNYDELVLNKIKEIHVLYQNGYITEEEYKLKRQKYIDNL